MTKVALCHSSYIQHIFLWQFKFSLFYFLFFCTRKIETTLGVRTSLLCSFFPCHTAQYGFKIFSHIDICVFECWFLLAKKIKGNITGCWTPKECQCRWCTLRNRAGCKNQWEWRKCQYYKWLCRNDNDFRLYSKYESSHQVILNWEVTSSDISKYDPLGNVWKVDYWGRVKVEAGRFVRVFLSVF